MKHKSLFITFYKFSVTDIMNLVEEKENESILKLVKERDKNDDGTRYTLEEVERMREQWK